MRRLLFAISLCSFFICVPARAEYGPRPIDEDTLYIQSIAAALNRDPVKIYEWVKNNIDFNPYYGVKRGATLTAMEREGNDFDTATLLVALLKASGYASSTYKYHFGDVTIACSSADGANACNWLGVSTPDAAVGQLHRARLFYYSAGRAKPSSDGTAIKLPHVWVSFCPDANGPTYILTPAFKRYKQATPLDLSVIQYSAAALTNSTAGISSNIANTTSGTSYTGATAGKNALRAQLAAYTTNLVNYAHDNAPALSGNDLVGGKQIQFERITTLPTGYPSGFTVVSEVSGFEAADYQVKLKITVGGLSREIPTSDLQGRKISLWYKDKIAQLWLDDDISLQTEESADTSKDAEVELAYSYPGNLPDPPTLTNPTQAWIDTIKTAALKRDGQYVISYSFGKALGRLQQRLRRQADYVDRGFGASDRPLLTENLYVMSLQYLSALNQFNEIAGGATQTHINLLHHAGIAGQMAVPYVDLPLNRIGVWPTAAVSGQTAEALSYRVSMCASFWFSMMEHTTIEQIIASGEGVSTVKMLQKSVELGKPVYLAKNWNDYLQIQPLLLNYPSAQTSAKVISTIEAGIRAGGQLLIPQSNAMVYNSYTGTGYMLTKPDAYDYLTTMGISGGFAGGYASVSTAVIDSNLVAANSNSSPDFRSLSMYFARHEIEDPLDMTTGAFTETATDMSLAGDSVHSLTLSRNYSSALRTSDPAGLGKGWTHSYNLQLNYRHPNDYSLGHATLAETAPLYIALKAMTDIYDPSATAKEYVISAMIACWMGDQLVNTRASVALGETTLDFVKLPDGTFAPPASTNASLVRNSDGTHTLTFRKGNKMTFRSADGKCTSIVDSNNSTSTARTLALTYTSAGFVNRVTDAYGRYFQFTYGGDSRLTSVADSAGRTVYYSKDAQSGKTAFAVTDPQGNTKRYYYDDKHRITEIEDARRQTVITSTYNDWDQVTEQIPYGESNHAVQLGFAYGVSRDTDAEGNSTWNYYDDRGRRHTSVDPLGATSTATYDGNDRILTTTNALGESESYEYNAYHEPTAVTNKANQRRTITPSGDDTAGNNIASEKNFQGESTTTAYYAFHKPQSISLPGGIKSEYEYDSRGRISKMHPASFDAGQWIQFAYTESGYVKRVIATYPPRTKISPEPADVSEQEISDFDAVGNLIQFIDRRGKKSTYIYDNNQRLLQVARWTGTYSAASAVGGTPPAGSILKTTTYNENGEIETETLDGKTIAYDHDAQGNLIETWGPDNKLLADNFYDTRGLLAVTYDAADGIKTYDYDKAKRLIESGDQLQRKTTQTYDLLGRPESSTSPRYYKAPELVATTTNYDAVGTVHSVEDPLNGPNYPINYTYDNDGRRKTLTNRRGNTYVTTYNDAARNVKDQTPLDTQSSRGVLTERNTRGLTTQITAPSGKITTFTAFDKEGRPTLKQDADGVYTGFVYAGGLLRTVSEPVSSAGADIVGQTRVTSRGYDDFGRLTSYSDGEGNTLNYAYDDSGNLKVLTYPGNLSVNYTYDAYNRMKTVTDWNQRLTTYDYDDLGRVKTVTRSYNGTKREQIYDSAGQVRYIAESRLAGANPIIWLRSFRYDNSGNDGAFYLNDGEITWSYTYPNVSGTTPAADSVAYNPDNQLATFNSLTVIHDADGNMTSGPLPNTPTAVSIYSYDGRNRLTAAGGIAYRYNADGLRVASSGNTYVVDPAAGLSRVLVRNQNGTITRYVWGLGLLYEETNSATRTYHYDHIGNTVALTDGAGQVTAQAEYSSYGQLVASSGTLATPFLFNGQLGVMTDDNGLIYMRARYYHPRLMRFINADPIRFDGGMNWYAFANGNPLSFTDPSGFCAHGTNSEPAFYRLRRESEPGDYFYPGRNPGEGFWDFVARNVSLTLANPSFMNSMAFGGPGSNFGGALNQNLRLESPATEAQLFTNKVPTDKIGVPNILPERVYTKAGFSKDGLIYVVKEDGTLVIGKQFEGPGGGHIDLAGGAPVRAAGEVRFVGGDVRMINNASGHYQPSGAAAQAAAEAAFQAKGFTIKPSVYINEH